MKKKMKIMTLVTLDVPIELVVSYDPESNDPTYFEVEDVEVSQRFSPARREVEERLVADYSSVERIEKKIEEAIKKG